ncbi:hypothetical protein ACMAZF_15485 [Psychrobium sp. nBUS_13]|uniref:hypothetical protein n=1 Tax=Psychrobium sp. nBUS_13 TaxID=3395319 RepID=UPI003EB898B8
MRKVTTFNIDKAQMGVGGDTSWGRMVHKQYQIEPNSMRYKFSLVPFTQLDKSNGQHLFVISTALSPIRVLLHGCSSLG